MRPSPLLLVPVVLALIAASGTRLRGGHGHARDSAGPPRDLRISVGRPVRAAPAAVAKSDDHGRLTSSAWSSSRGRQLKTVGGSGAQQQYAAQPLPSISHPLPDVNSNPTQLVYIDYHAPVGTTNLSSLFHVNGSTMYALPPIDHPQHNS